MMGTLLESTHRQEHGVVLEKEDLPDKPVSVQTIQKSVRIGHIIPVEMDLGGNA